MNKNSFKPFFLSNCMSYEFLEHTADVKFRAIALNLEDAFVDSAKALLETVRGDIEILKIDKKNIEISGESLENLLYRFLEEFLFLLDSENFLASEIESLEIDRKKNELRAVLVGDSAENYHFTNDVKAITYNALEIKERERVTVTGVFDV